MVNLLFISNNSKIDTIKNVLQPLLKVKIDVVGDFDFGLKDVFEKRPAIVFIQEQIAGVAGESVARHIQMLLGSGAPSFIFMHDGNIKAKPIKGLYDYLIDLSQPDTKVLTGIQSTLKLLLGPQWQKIYVHPKANKPVFKATKAVPDEHRVVANQLVDDFISDLKNVSPAPNTSTYSLTDFAAQDVAPDEPFTIVSSHQDQLAEIMSETAEEQQGIETATTAARDVTTEKIISPSGARAPSVQNEPPATVPESSKPDVHKAAVVSASPSSVPLDSVPVDHVAPTVQKHFAPTVPGVSERLQSPPISPADFRIERERIPEEVAQEESLKDFEENYLSKTAARKWYQALAVVLVLCLIGWWYLVKQKPHLMHSVVKESPPATVPAPATQPVTPVPVVDKPVSATQRPETAVLPTFIPVAGHDSSFAAQKPGWERYLGTDSEFRVFCSGGKLKAVQVLAIEGHVISEARMKTILVELTGTGEYRITSHEQKHGFQVSHASVNRKADLLIYREKTAVHAFVVSLD